MYLFITSLPGLFNLVILLLCNKPARLMNNDTSFFMVYENSEVGERFGISQLNFIGI